MDSKKLLALLGSILVLLLILLGEEVPSSNVTPNESRTDSEVVRSTVAYPIVEVVDGDTVKISVNGKIETYRLIGVDTPETVHPTKGVECFGVEASNRAKTILTGEKVFIETDSSQGTYDKYNRRLAYIFLEDGTNLNLKMIREGYAHEYTYSLPYKYQLQFKEAEVAARSNKVGLWADNACTVS
ncbi:MAG TPA: thermonuclease family protein [Candidatus Paceibacterota bacterium]|jgi:micrococcal nuclease